MLPTPSTSHVSLDKVYEPAEDSFLLLDTLSSHSEIQFLSNRFHQPQDSPLIVEVGTGSGVILGFITAHAATIFGRPDILTFGTDVNEHACKAATITTQKAMRDDADPAGAAVFCDTILTDLVSSIRFQTIDVLIFNPPYVPTEEPPVAILAELDRLSSPSALGNQFEIDSKLLALSYAGGVDGMETTDRLLAELPAILHPERGMAYILLCSQNQPNKVVERIRQWGPDWCVESIGHSGRKAGREILQILRIWRERRAIVLSVEG
jgi:release factor glutamine methyltransferase